MPITFHLAPDRTVTLCADVVAVPDYSRDAAKRGRLSEDEIQDRIREYLQGQDAPVPQKQIIDDLKGEPGVTYHPLRKALIACAVPEYAGMPVGTIYIRTEHAFNRKTYGVSR